PGISGDMMVGALADAGADQRAIVDAISSLATGAELSFEKVKRGSLAATKFHVSGVESKKHRHLHHILELIQRSGLSELAKQRASAVFQRLGEVEAAVHGVPIERVHFHEVGAVDSIADIVGACVALDLLDVAEVHASAVNVGSGNVQTEHGLLPVPAPATARLLEGKPIYARGPEVELTTPTGAALAVTLASSFGPLPAMRISSIGHGAGDRDVKQHPNVTRVLIGDRTT